MKDYKQLELKEKIKGNYFYISCDTQYFHNWARVFILSAKELAPSIGIHCHIFDMRSDDKNWCEENDISYTFEDTPKYYTSIQEKKERSVTKCGIVNVECKLILRQNTTFGAENKKLLASMKSELCTLTKDVENEN